MELITDTIALTGEQYAVYSCISYFDIFRYPVLPKQILDFLTIKITQSQVNLILNELVELKLVHEANGFYFLEKVNANYIDKRQVSEKYFFKKKSTIQRYANFISRFPFVEAVAISGSCSKGLLEKDGDVDYFIITTPGKLWLCRTLLVAFKKVFLFNSRKYFCINYLVDSDNLQIPDKNAFVATEIKTLAPVNNRILFEHFLNANKWTTEFLPNKNKYDKLFLKDKKTRKYFFGILELLLDNRVGDVLDKMCFKLTLSSWQKKFPGFNKEDFDLNLRSRKNVSKHHPQGFQQKVLSELNKRLEKIKILSA